MHSDSLVMSGPYEKASTEVLHRLIEQAEAAQVAGPVGDAGDYLVGFSTALTDEERRYLDLCAELFARVGDAAGRQPCGGEQQPEELAA